MYEEQRKLVQQQAQTKAQLARYEDELTRKEDVFWLLKLPSSGVAEVKILT
jgi:hypothetical protein